MSHLYVSDEEFEKIVGEALDLVPAAFMDLLENVVFLVEANAPEPGLLGLYDGVPLPERSEFDLPVLPDRITIYKNPLLQMCNSRAQLRREVSVTVVHEIAHHFGIDDATLHELGWA
ncbi:metallopeptidase family protein [Dermatophilus congolensis]|uniref:Uncharacterized protein conserved in bacteria n=1 Tax=Dermatophilus congolensis TaxID=1863 RepID=A0A239VPL9_9MICO|nr:metallopeptidase family protein [Dermatophilus congolensis]MBO3129620.1 metallopeptidase family protein [Dermatophilus congolensis]MBO3131747.1 metallopeptidase family protein [Dermatophilus congolensis]MBO3134096.1 metallopeptidase family protein [Dermatophilus congolensis]MBO3136328.1 metallopeptidase family protein [Dermatophilus congolensis]MBO3138576.1 metallopeptidase family protein [Dermatophilus congolensis]